MSRYAEVYIWSAPRARQLAIRGPAIETNSTNKTKGPWEESWKEEGREGREEGGRATLEDVQVKSSGSRFNT